MVPPPSSPSSSPGERFFTDRAVLERIRTGLPAGSLMDPLLDRAAEGPLRLVIQAPPGTGKTTVVPPVVAARGVGRLVVTQPRRVAARAAARRLAQLTGTRVGDVVGYTVRGDRQVCAHTQIEFVTTGVLNRRLLNDPDLPGVAGVVIDEVHERSLETDLAAAFLQQVSLLREDFDLVVMSATAQSDLWASYFDAEVLSVEAETYPLTELWAPMEGTQNTKALDSRGVRREFLSHVAAVTRDAASNSEGDVLVFLPGGWEISTVSDQIPGALTLSGSTPSAEQDRILSGSNGTERRIILATNIAESALTVPGVRTVVDAGLDRQQRLDTVRGMSGLVTVGASKASMVQRAGRAARLGPGTVIRCMSPAEFAARAEHSPAEIATADLTDTVLEIAAWGEVDLVEPMPPQSRAMAVNTLRWLGAVSDDTGEGDGEITELGRRLVTLPVDARLGRALIEGTELFGAHVAAEAAAVLSLDHRTLTSAAGPGRQIHDQVDAWSVARSVRQSSVVARETQRFREILSRQAEHTPQKDTGDEHLTEASLGVITALAAPDRIARRRGGDSAGTDTEFLLASGTAAQLPARSGTQLKGHEWLAVRDISLHRGSPVIRSAVAIDQDIAETALPPRQQRRVEVRQSGSSSHSGTPKITVREELRLGAIVLSSTPVSASSEEETEAYTQLIAEDPRGVDVLNPSEAFRQVRQRLRFAHRWDRNDWPDPDSVDPQFWAEHRADLTTGVKTLIGWDRLGELDQAVPERLQVPSGSHYRVDYEDLDKPVLAVKLQEMFGATQSPEICGVKVVLHLLSPAGRPLAVTADLPFFWSEVYPQVRAENRNRYAKHPWPEDPAHAEPTRLTNRALKNRQQD